MDKFYQSVDAAIKSAKPADFKTIGSLTAQSVQNSVRLIPGKHISLKATLIFKF